MDAVLFALILEVVLLQLRIIEGTTKLRAQCWDFNTKDAKIQYEKLARDRGQRPAQTVEARKLKFEKQETDRILGKNLGKNTCEVVGRCWDTVRDVVRRTLIELAETGNFQMLRNAIDVLRQRASSAVSMRFEYEHLKRTRDELAEELEEKRLEWVKKLRDADYDTAIMRDNMNDAQLNANMRMAYAEKWLLARAESVELQWQKPTGPLPNMDNEVRVHAELLRAFEMQIKERQESLAHWQQRYVTDFAAIKKRLAVKTEELRVVAAKREELQKLFDLHEGEMRAWLTFKRERAARLAREEHLRACATRIQAWWRGTMVRRGMGAFRFMRNLKKTPSKKKK